MSQQTKITSIPADAICMQCGTAQEDPVTGFCINGHDDWLEDSDDPQRFADAQVILGCTMQDIASAIKNNTNLKK